MDRLGLRLKNNNSSNELYSIIILFTFGTGAFQQNAVLDLVEEIEMPALSGHVVIEQRSCSSQFRFNDYKSICITANSSKEKAQQLVI